jgi:glyceraldehyde-3-phosphate dehydrogenase (NADP+)
MADDIFHEIVEDHEHKIYRYFTGELWTTSSSGKIIPVLSPYDQSVVGNIQAVTQEEADQVISLAKTVQRKWEQASLETRIAVVKNAARLLREYEEVFASMLTLEIGKTHKEAISEVSRTADIIEFSIQEARNIRGYSMVSDGFPGYKNGIVANIERVAHGVVLAIGPFNYPLNLVASKIAPGLLMGNSVVVKPPTQGSICGLMLVRVFHAAGVPKGVMSCITAEGRHIGEYLTTHPGISMIAFTGSSSVGQLIAKQAGMKPLLFECGGNNAVIILPDADINLTAKEIVRGGFSYAGQRCTGIKYVLGTKETLDRVLPAVVDLTSLQAKDMGPLISLASAEEIEQVIQEALSQGAQVATGGKRTGTYIEPTILTNVSKDMRVVKEETFGPVVSFITVSSADEAIGIINDSRYGLQASIFTQDEERAKHLAKRLQVGTVQINGSPQRGPDNFPFMGIKESGLGVQGIRYSLEAMSRLQSIVVNPSNSSRDL